MVLSEQFATTFEKNHDISTTMNVDPGRDHAARQARLPLLRMAALHPRDRAVPAWEAWRAAGDPWNPDAASRWWFPLVWWNLKADINGDTSEALRAAYTENWVRMQHRYARVALLLDGLHHSGVPTLLLKGPALALTVYERPGLRPFRDVHVLVRPENAHNARSILERGGCVPFEATAPRARACGHLGYTSETHGVSLRLHWSAFTDGAGGARRDDSGLWERAVPTDLGGTRTHALCPSDQLLHVCARAGHPSPPSSETWMADAITILRRSVDVLSWDHLIAEAHIRGLEAHVRRAFKRLTAHHADDCLVAQAALTPRPDARSRKGARRDPPEATRDAVQIPGRGPQRRDARPPTTPTMASGKQWGGTITLALDAIDRGIEVGGDAGVDLRLLRRLLRDRLPAFHRPRRRALPARVYHVLGVDDARGTPAGFRVLVDHLPLAAASNLEEAADQVVNDLQAFLAITLEGCTFVHAGVVTLSDRAVLLPGASGSGKSTLVAALLRAGAGYYSDEFALLDPNGLVYPYRRPLGLRLAFGAQRLRWPAWQAAGPPAQGSSAATILFSPFRPGGMFEPVRLTPSDAMLRLLSHCPGAQARPADTLASLRALVLNTPAWASERGDTEAAVAALLDGRFTRAVPNRTAL